MISPNAIGKKLEKRGQAQGRFDVVTFLVRPNRWSRTRGRGRPNAGRANRDQEPVTDSEIERELVLFGELHIAHADVT
jgi:hypothetical protein